MEACSMTGIQSVNSLWLWYHGLTLLILAAFAEYDIRHRKIINRALVPFFFWCLLSIPVNLQTEPIFPFFCVYEAILGFLFGGLLLLTVTMISHGGIGGGDIKLTALMGILYGPYGILFILAAASASVILYHTMEEFLYGRRSLSLPFAPFLFFGSLIELYLQCRM